MRYDHTAIEKKWQERWDSAQAHRAEDVSEKETAYILDMFPYPSGAGLHVGHVEGYTATDIYARFLRAKEKNVLHPIGWDAFGLPAENYAIKTKVHPKITTEEAIKNFIRQIKSLGLSYDWSREIGTHRPDYYTWTQWFFLLLYKHNLAYRAKAKVNWCESCKTVLANEQVIDGKCDRSGDVVIQKDLEQWFFRITDYAEELIDGLDQIDWPESTKAAQRHWIGKSKGSEIDFKISGTEGVIRVFTTRADTLFGATYMVLAPEHPQVDVLKERISNWDEVVAYRERTAKRSELERTSDTGEKTGVELKGVTVINPGTGENVPVFIADYVLLQYATGAIMAVPAHDERDAEFAKIFTLPVKKVIAGGKDGVPHTEPGTLIDSGTFTGLTSEEAKEKITLFVRGELKTSYRLRDWLISRQRYWGAPIPMIYCEDCGAVPVPEKDLPVVLPDDVDFMPTGESPLVRSESFHNVNCPTCGKKARRESDTMDTFVCSSWYYFRFTDPQNLETFASKEKIEKWLPVDLYVGGAEHTVLHLLYARFFTKVLQKLGYVSFNEPFAKLRHQGLILAEGGQKMSKSLGNVVNPDDVVSEFGADSIRLYEMFMGPLDVAKPWNTKNIVGVRRFLERVYALREKVGDAAMTSALDTLLNQTIQKVTEDITHLRFNTAISQMMVYVNELTSLEVVPRAAYAPLVQILTPFAPHIGEELWEALGNKTLVSATPWPAFDPAKTVADVITVGVQVNGKVRGTIEVGREESETLVLERARANPGVAKWLGEGKEVKAVYVSGRIVSFVVEKLDQ